MKIQRLNMDNSWCIEFAGKSLLIDPWLTGVEVDYFPWFNTQWRKTKPLDIAEVPEFDLVIITQKYPDHFHPTTLKALNPKTIIVPKSIEKAVKKLLPNAHVWNLETALHHAADISFNVHFIPTLRKIDPIYDAIVLENGEESILIATHGYSESNEWAAALKKLPPIKLAFTPFNRYKLPFFLGGTVAPGLAAVERLIKTHKPEHLVATHDEDKHAKGLVHKFAKITFSPSHAELMKNNLFENRLITITDYAVHTI